MNKDIKDMTVEELKTQLRSCTTIHNALLFPMMLGASASGICLGQAICHNLWSLYMLFMIFAVIWIGSLITRSSIYGKMLRIESELNRR